MQLWPFRIYVAGVILIGQGFLAVSVARAGASGLVGSEPVIFWLFAGLLLLAELRPIDWLRREDGGEITASWTFAFALLLVAPIAGAVVAMAAACVISDLIIGRKPPVKVLFNVSQICLSLGAGGAILGLQSHGVLQAGGPSFAWLLVATLAGTAVFVLNGVLASIVLALYQDVPVWPVLRSGVGSNLSTDGMLLAMAPVFVLIAHIAAILLPLLLLTAGAVHRSARLALARQHDATHDELTSLPNRRYFMDTLASALATTGRRGQRLGVVVLDLDGFKEINDRFGHDVGDEVLREVGRRLRQEARANEIVARLGGDEFAALLRNIASLEEAEAAAQRLLHELRCPIVVRGLPISAGGSVGVAVFPEHGEDSSALMKHADLAMYSAKNGGRGVQLYVPRAGGADSCRLSLLGELREAIGRDELVLHYQPQVELETGRVVSVEALVRWQHPTLGLVMPGDFMPLAEHTELMGPLTERVLGMALRQAAQWARSGLELGMAVNASARNLHDLRFPHTVERLLEDSGLEPRLLELEITENTVMSDPARTAAVLERLRDMGVTLSIDDFGTGYSSLAHLRDLPVHRIKIDRSFVQHLMSRPGDALIVGSVIQLARGMGLGTVAEGVEDEPTSARLRGLGADLGQGYHFARPRPAAECLPLILGVLSASPSGLSVVGHVGEAA